jgi:hypothetical protein
MTFPVCKTKNVAMPVKIIQFAEASLSHHQDGHPNQQLKVLFDNFVIISVTKDILVSIATKVEPYSLFYEVCFTLNVAGLLVAFESMFLPVGVQPD